METKICPHCHQSYIVKSPEEIERDWQAMGLYYELGDGCVWSPPRIGFYSTASAKTFKNAYPEYDVIIIQKRPELTAVERRITE